jgi:hypothetical protein
MHCPKQRFASTAGRSFLLGRRPERPLERWNHDRQSRAQVPMQLAWRHLDKVLGQFRSDTLAYRFDECDTQIPKRNGRRDQDEVLKAPFCKTCA